MSNNTDVLMKLKELKTNLEAIIPISRNNPALKCAAEELLEAVEDELSGRYYDSDSEQ